MERGEGAGETAALGLVVGDGDALDSGEAPGDVAPTAGESVGLGDAAVGVGEIVGLGETTPALGETVGLGVGETVGLGVGLGVGVGQGETISFQACKSVAKPPISLSNSLHF